MVAAGTRVAEVGPTGRVAAVDDLRALLVAWVIGGHALMGYTRIGGWPWDEVQETTMRPGTELVVTVVLGPTALVVIGAFFFLAGLFAPAQVRRAGPAGFARSRLVRLGVPWVLGTLLVWPTLMWLAHLSAGYAWTWGEAFLRRTPFLDSGPLWFLQVLLYVSLAYALWCATAGRRVRPVRRRPVGGWHLLAAAVLVAASSYLVRIVYPARSQQVLDLHLWQWPQCVGMFALGVLVGDQGWATRVPPRLARGCLAAVVAALATAGLVAATAGLSDLARGGAPYLGGGTWQSAVLAGVEAVLVVAGSVVLLAVAQRWRPGPARWRRAAFAAYLLQAPVLIGAEIALRPTGLPAGVKAAVLAVFAVVTCYVLGAFLTRRPRSGPRPSAAAVKTEITPAAEPRMSPSPPSTDAAEVL